MRNKRQLFLVTLLAIDLGAAPLLAANETAKKEAVESAEAWLELVDAGEYEQSWEKATVYFRDAVTEEQWKQSLSAVRTPLGKVLSRKVISKQYVTSLPGAPDGEYVVIQFETSFENKKSSVETVTPMLEKDGKWSVAGYFIK